MIEYLMNPQSVEALGWTLLHSLWQGAVFAILLALLFIVLRSYTAQSRYVVASGLLAAFFLTVGTTFWYQWQSANERSEIAHAQTTTQQSNDVLLLYTNNTEEQRDIVAANIEINNNAIIISKQSNWLPVFSNYYERHLPLLVTIWLLGVLFLQLRFLGQLAYVQRLKHYGTQLIPDIWNVKIEELESKLRIQKKVQYLTSLRIESPMVIGWLKPVVLLPRQLLQSLSDIEIFAVLAHELAHIRREDFIVNLMQTLLCNIFFFHPGVWWMSNRVDEEREHCCDDLAVAATGQATSYAKTLINVSEQQLNMHRNAPLAMAFSGKNKQRDRGTFASRIRRLFVVGNGAGTFREGFATACILFVALIIAIAATGHTVQASESQKSSQVENDGIETISLAENKINTIENDFIIKEDHSGIDSETISNRTEAPASAEPPVKPDGQVNTRIDALLMACAEGDLEFVITLIKSDIDINGIGSEGFTPLMMAASENKTEIVSYLISSGADVNKVCYGWTALLEAADEGSLESMKQLLDAGAKVNYYSSTDNPTAITMAASEGHLDCLKLLLQNGADINGIGESLPPLHIAAEEGKKEIIEYLISQKVSINKKDSAGRTALMYAASEGQKYSAEILISAGADKSIIDSDGATAEDHAEAEDEYDTQDYLSNESVPGIHQATQDGLIEKVQRMIKNGIDVNTRDEVGRTPLHIAAAMNHDIDMRVLIDLGADINAQDKQGKTPLMYAAADGKRGAAVLLVSKLADVNIQDVDGMRALEWSHNGGNRDLVKFLELITEKNPLGDRNAEGSRTENELRKIENENRSLNNELRRKEAEERFERYEKRLEEGEMRLEDNEMRQEEKAIRKEKEVREKMQKELEKRSEKRRQKTEEQLEKNRDKSESVNFSKDGIHIRQFDIEEEVIELMNAARSGSIEECRRLINNGADVNATDDTGQTALMVAAMSNRVSIARLLIDNRADINMSSISGLTALHFAALENHLNFTKFLLENNAKVDATMRYSSTDGNTTSELLAWEYIGATPLLIAVESNNVEIAKALIQAGANPDHKLTKIEYRLKKGSQSYLGLSEVIGIDETFKEHANIKVSDNSWTPKKQAQQMNNYKILKLR